MRYHSPLRYPGGKARLWHLLDKVIRSADLSDCTYVEPYAGGAGAALALLERETVSRVIINDADPAIAAFWRAVTEHTDQFCGMVEDARLTVQEWQRQRSTHASGSAASVLELGFAAFYLNRTNRSGIIGSGGIIGGLKQNGRWKMDARFSRTELIKRITWVGSQRDRIRVSCRDALELLKGLKRRKQLFVYLDPPYYHQAERLYERWYRPADHAKVSEAVKRLSHPWIVSYDDCPEIRKLYKGLRSRKLSLQYTAADRYLGAEVLFFSPKLMNVSLR